MKTLLFSVLFLLLTTSCDQLGSEFLGAEIEFEGVNRANFKSGYELYISWDPAITKGEAEVDVAYQVFVQEDLENTDFSLQGDEAYLSRFIDDKPDIESGFDPVAVLRDQSFVVIPWDYEAGVAYQVYVRAINTIDGEVLAPKRYLRFGVKSFRPLFEGLQANGVSLNESKNSINLNWEPAIGAVGELEYLVFQSNTFVTPIAITKNTQFVVDDLRLGKTYQFAVRARDSRGQDSNTNVVSITVPDPRDLTPPEFDGLNSVVATSHQSLYLDWTPTTAEDFASYLIYADNNLSSPIVTTREVGYTINGLDTNTEYAFVVRVKDEAGNEDGNTIVRSQRTLSYQVPEFEGVSTVVPASGFLGLNRLDVNWVQASFDDSVSAD